MRKWWFRTLVGCTLTFIVVPIPAHSALAQPNALSFELEWNGSADLDLMVQQPDGTWIDYDDPSAASGGSLDAAQGNNFCEEASANPREEISWADDAPTGTYWINVSLFDACGTADAQPFTLTVASGGRVLEQMQGVVFSGQDNIRLFNFIFPGASAFPEEVENAPEATGGLGGLLGGATNKPTAVPQPDQPDAVPEVAPDGETGPIQMGDANEVAVPLGPMRVQVTWPSVPDLDVDLMAKELGTMIAHDEPVSASGAELSDDFGNSFCAGQTLPNSDLYGEEIVWTAEPMGSTVEVSVALIGICGPSGFVLPGEEVAQFTLAVYDAQGQPIYGPVQGTTDSEGLWGVTLRFAN